MPKKSRKMLGDELESVGYKANLRIEKKSDWETVEQINYRAFRDAPPTGSGDDGKLNAKLAEPMDVDEYIDAQPLMHKDKLRTVRQIILMALPDATEKISWQMPTYWRGKNLIHFAAQKYHIGIYPGAEAMEYFKPRLAKYKTSKGAIQLPYTDFGSEELNLIAEIAAWCGKEK